MASPEIYVGEQGLALPTHSETPSPPFPCSVVVWCLLLRTGSFEDQEPWRLPVLLCKGRVHGWGHARGLRGRRVGGLPEKDGMKLASLGIFQELEPSPSHRVIKLEPFTLLTRQLGHKAFGQAQPHAARRAETVFTTILCMGL